MNQSGVRTTGRIKKPKMVYDPSDNYLPRAVLQQQPRVSQNHAGAIAGASVESKKSFSSPEQQQQQKAHVSTGSSDNTSGYSKKPIHMSQLRRASQMEPKKVAVTVPLTEMVTDSDSERNKVFLTDLCYVCQKTGGKRGVAARNKLIPCLGCTNKIHKLCLPVVVVDFDIDRIRYRCKSCNFCDLCKKALDAADQQNLICTKCLKTFHRTCLKTTESSKGWQCNDCKEIPAMDDDNSDVSKTTVGDDVTFKQEANTPDLQSVNIIKDAAPSLTNGSAKGEKSGGNLKKEKETKAVPADNIATKVATPVGYTDVEPNDLPDVKGWSVDNVHAYIAKYFPNEAQVFKEHEIDGQSLLLLKRSDVVKKLPIKLGPALRIYALILKIQTQINDSTLAWNCPDF